MYRCTVIYSLCTFLPRTNYSAKNKYDVTTQLTVEFINHFDCVCLCSIFAAKTGDNCIEKPLATLWRNYTQINKPDVTMRILVCSSGLKATTRQHGLTEYWANRITYCCSPKNYPRVFCWIYRHEGRKLKHELRCHAVLCPKESIAEEICKTLKVSETPKKTELV